MLLFVSHDRYFINQFAGRVWMLENQKISDFRGTYQEYLAWKDRQKAFAKGTPPPAREEPKKEKPRRSGGTKELEKQVNAAERAVARAEERQYGAGPAGRGGRLQLSGAAKGLRGAEGAGRREIAHLYTRWEALAAELEEARG